jgi:hypothetical protein
MSNVAHDTFLLARSQKGLERMNHWVNTFCENNYISMNETKTKPFGLDENRKDIQMSLPVIQHGKEGEIIMKTAKAQPAAKHIKHLGLWMNMNLDWSRAEAT